MKKELNLVELSKKDKVSKKEMIYPRGMGLCVGCSCPDIIDFMNDEKVRRSELVPKK